MAESAALQTQVSCISSLHQRYVHKIDLVWLICSSKNPLEKKKKKKRFILVEQSIAELAEEAEKGHGVSINQQDYTV